MSTNQSFDFFVQWHLTDRCNLRCSHCYQESPSQNEMSLPEIRETLKEIADTLTQWKHAYGVNFSPSFNITGGEPFLRKDIFEILSEISGYGIDTYLLSNGTLIDPVRAMTLSDLNIKGVQVSIEGLEKVHDTIRGKGSFSASLEGIRNLLDAGVPVTLNSTLSALNSHSFINMLDLSANVGVQKIGFSRLVPAGRGNALRHTMLRSDIVRDTYKKIFSITVPGLEIVTGDPVASQALIEHQYDDCGNVALGGCAAGISGLTILPDGTLLPCRRLNIPLGNVRKDSLREVWATSDVLGSLRDRSRYEGKCGSCKRWANCRGCRAIAYACSKSKGQNAMLAEDPQCFINTGF